MNNVISLRKYKNISETAVVIPARLKSTRFPNKMLEEVVPGVTLIEFVYNQVCAVHDPKDVFVATDSQEIADLFEESNVVMTPEDCANGTERIAEASKKLHQYSYFINVQGDMIDVPLNCISTIECFLESGAGEVVTVCKEMGEEDRNNPSTVKCVNNGDTAHWFCRAPLQYGDWHLGIYGYTKEALEEYGTFDVYEEEKFESLEQLRWIQNFYNIGIIWTEEHASEINTPEDLEKWKTAKCL